MDGAYAVASIAMRYWFIVAAAVVLIGAVGISVKEYRDKRFVLGVAKSSIGYFHVVSGPREIFGENIHLMPENIIGRSKNSDIRILDKSVSKIHSEVYIAFDGRVYITRTGRGEVTVNGAPVDLVGQVKDGDMITIGNILFRLHLKEVS